MFTAALPQEYSLASLLDAYEMIGAHSVIPYPIVYGKPIVWKNSSASLLKAAPPIIISLKLPPKVVTSSDFIFS
jgi:hypothetical protein